MTRTAFRGDVGRSRLVATTNAWAAYVEPVASITRSGCHRHRSDAVRTALSGEVRDWLEDRSLAAKSLESMTQDELDEVYDAAYIALINAAPIVRSYTARQDTGRYPVWIAGIEGCVSANGV